MTETTLTTKRNSSVFMYIEDLSKLGDRTVARDASALHNICGQNYVQANRSGVSVLIPTDHAGRVDEPALKYKLPFALSTVEIKEGVEQLKNSKTTPIELAKIMGMEVEELCAFMGCAKDAALEREALQALGKTPGYILPAGKQVEIHSAPDCTGALVRLGDQLFPVVREGTNGTVQLRVMPAVKPEKLSAGDIQSCPLLSRLDPQIAVWPINGTKIGCAQNESKLVVKNVSNGRLQFSDSCQCYVISQGNPNIYYVNDSNELCELSAKSFSKVNSVKLGIEGKIAALSTTGEIFSSNA